jgi:hypothetical protein
VFDLMNQTPKTVSRQENDPIVTKLQHLLKGLDWVRDFKIRMREEGHILYGEAFIIARDTTDILPKIPRATDQACDLDWRIKDFVLAVVDELPE